MTISVNNNPYNYECKIKEDKSMNFTAYIERQKNLIRHRHDGETYLINKEGVIPVTESDKILFELSNLKGLNKRERLNLKREAV